MHTKSVMHHNNLNILGIANLKDFLAEIAAAPFCAIHIKRYIYVIMAADINVSPACPPPWPTRIRVETSYYNHLR